MLSQLLTTVAAPPPGESGDGFLAGEKKINLDLRIGNCACEIEGGLKRIVQEKGESIFTDAQFHELCSQIFIYNSIVYGFPVAFHLLLPIWTSVFKSVGPAIYNTYPSFSGFSSKKSDHSSVMDSEPGRCKRTDGRKWRCSKNVVPLQKYCERHMHRGRQCSRKHVEPIGRVSRHDNRQTSDGSRVPLVASTDVDDRVSISIQNDLGPSQPCSTYRSGFPAILKCRDNETCDALFATANSMDACSAGNGASSGISFDYARSTCTSSRANYSTSGGDRADAKSRFDDANAININSRKHNVVGRSYAGFSSPGFGLSPKSVLIAAGKAGLGSGCTTIMEAEPQRCRRTDGKKWQCRRDALPDHKYCEVHMHRGAKRLGVNPEYSRSFQANTAWTAHKSCPLTRNLDSGINLNTIPASPLQNCSSSSSDATTITDENISFCLAKLPPQ